MILTYLLFPDLPDGISNEIVFRSAGLTNGMNNNSTNLPIGSILPNPQTLGRGIGILPQTGANQARSPINGRHF